MTANWTTPITWNVDQLVTDDDLNEQVRDNLEYLLSPNHERIIYSTGGTYDITNVTTFQDVDATNLSIDLETHGGPVLVHLQAMIYCSTGSGYFGGLDIAVDGTRVGDEYTYGLLYARDSVTKPISLWCLVPGLAAGTHTFRPQWRSSSGGSVHLVADVNYSAVIFEVIEL